MEMVVVTELFKVVEKVFFIVLVEVLLEIVLEELLIVLLENENERIIIELQRRKL